MILNPYIPSVDMSKIAFSYGLGRAAKLTSIEQSVKKYLTDIASIPAALCHVEYQGNQMHNRVLTGKLLSIQQRLVKGSRDGLLGTSDLKWSKPELEGYVNKISSRFDVSTRIDIIHKQLGTQQQIPDSFIFQLTYSISFRLCKRGCWCCQKIYLLIAFVTILTE